MSRSTSKSDFDIRRSLLKLGSCGAMTNATFLSTMMHLKSTSAVLAGGPSIPPDPGYKAIVCLFFNAAIDSFNVLTPHGTTQADPRYAEYVTTRTGAALKRKDLANGIDDGPWVGTDYGYLNPITDNTAGSGRVFGLHPRLPKLKQIYDNGHCAFVANTGALVEPLLNNSDYSNAAKIKPVGLFSHPDQQRHWQTAVPTSRNQARGWAGKMADLMTDPALMSNNVYTAISTAGQSLLLTGNRIFSYSVGAVTDNIPPINGGAIRLDGIGSTSSAMDRIYNAAHTDFASQTYSDILERTIRDYRVGARDSASTYQAAFEAASLPTTGDQFPTSGLGSQLAAVARSIKIASDPAAIDPLKQNRQIFLVQINGWDHHANLLSSQNTMLPLIDNGLKAFYDFLQNSSLLNNVTLFTISDFARTWSFNGSGSDHAWGANPFVMGGAVNGGKVYGTYPNIVFNTSSTGIDRGRGVIIPQTSSDLYHAEICRWFGVPDSRLTDVLPNLRNFSYQGSGGHPVGFMNYT
ncbi:MAG: DUF1501 domain-containing protein [Pirellulaceae bacterium]|nr:DUF1501 domain-containing protein [Pirellulaceae bacterium]